jgi:acetylornithine deacetylase/succinyl-diaminopimelate desuccinylase-like protein
VKALRWVQDQLSFPGLHFRHYRFSEHPALVVTTQDSMRPDIFLVAHMDVVPASKRLFNPEIAGKKLIGRGAYDMKMAIACYLLLFHELRDRLPELNIGLMLTSDEEEGGMHGVKRLLESGYSSQVAFLPDGGFDWNFEEEAKGVLQIKISARGKSSHSSRPGQGENAIEILIGAISDIHRHFEELRARFGEYHPTVNVGMIHGGRAVNQVPAFVEANIDIRHPHALAGKELYEDITKLLRRDPRLTVEITAEGASFHVDVRKRPFVQFQKIAREMYGIDIGKVRSNGASDARFFGERDIPILVISPHGGNIHSDEEWVDLEDLTRFYHVLKEWVLSQ